ncbi:MAG: hypothetical protein FRX49_08999 [Trebouxia sp. A1-2]|nr:MAG: hypothetical protein FRX49_08999 [Trebouxia sp. A1-2]
MQRKWKKTNTVHSHSRSVLGGHPSNWRHARTAWTHADEGQVKDGVPVDKQDLKILQRLKKEWTQEQVRGKALRYGEGHWIQWATSR